MAQKELVFFFKKKNNNKFYFKIIAEKMKINFLGEIPLHSKIRETSDFGKPISVIEPNSTHAISYLNISKRVIEIIENENFIKEKPNIVIE